MSQKSPGTARTVTFGSMSRARSATASALLRPVSASRSRMLRVRLCSSTVSKSYTSMVPQPSNARFFTTSLPTAPAPITAMRVAATCSCENQSIRSWRR